jgi:chromosome segregation ATPase
MGENRAVLNLIAAPTQYMTTHLRAVLALAAAGALLVAATVFGALWVDASSDRDSLEGQITEARSELNDARSEVMSLEAELETARSSLEEVEGNLQTTQANLKTLQQQVADLRLQLGVTETNLGTSRQETATTRDQLSQTQGQLAAVQADVNAARQQLTAVQDQLRTADADLAQTRSDAQRCRAAGQSFVNAVNAFDAVLTRWFDGQATEAEVDAAAAQVNSAYNGFVANCNLQS